MPARTPVYFQLLDERGYAVQTMRSWSTLQSGETQSCIGCHESKHEAPPPMLSLAAIGSGPRKLTPFDQFAAQHGVRNPITDTSLTPREAVKALLAVNAPNGLGPPEGFSYVREIQPIFDKHCEPAPVGPGPTTRLLRQAYLLAGRTESSPDRGSHQQETARGS